METSVLDTPIGLLRITSADDAVLRIDFLDPGEATPEGDGGKPGALLAEYFAGDIPALERIEVADMVGTPFQRRVWAALRDIPAGQTISYGQLAAAIGQPTAVRAVGSANGANPVPVVVPCHRVIRTGGAMGGYGGGLDRKQWLLEHERRHLGDAS